MTSSLRMANLFVALLFFVTAACAISTAGHVVVPLNVILWVAALVQIVIGVGPLRAAVAGDKAS